MTVDTIGLREVTERINKNKIDDDIKKKEESIAAETETDKLILDDIKVVVYSE